MAASPQRALLEGAVARGVITASRLRANEDTGSTLRRLLAEGALTEKQILDLASELRVTLTDSFLRKIRPHETTPRLSGEPPSPPLIPGSPFGPAGADGKAHYEIRDIIGRGGMGVVYKAWDNRLGRAVAVKFVQVGEEQDLARLEREARLAAQLSHPSIAAVYEMGLHESRPFLAMQLIEGRTLEDASDEKALPLRDACASIRDAARAVHYAHQHGIIHRDLKPGNIMLDKAGHTTVLDFGLARAYGAGSTISVTGDIMGTPAFMSPEQASGDVDMIGPISDIYALGATLYAATTGRAPFRADNPARVLMLVIDAEPAAPRRINSLIHADVETIILKTIDKRPERRYGSAGELADDLDRFLRGEPIQARRLSWPERARRRIARNLPLSIALAGVVLAGVGGAAALVVQSVAGAREHARLELRALVARNEAAQAQVRRSNALSYVQSAAGLIQQLSDFKDMHGQSAETISAYEPKVMAAMELAMKEDASTPEIYAWLGAWLAVVDEHDAAEAEFDHACELGPQSVVAFFRRGRYYARRYLDSIELPVTRTTGSGVEFGHMNVETGAPWRDRALADLKRVEELAARGGLTHVEVQTVEAVLKFLGDKPAEARTILDALIAEWPWVMELFLYRSYVNTMLQDHAAAVRDMEALVHVWQENGEAFFHLATFRLNQVRVAAAKGEIPQKELESCIEAFTRAEQLLPAERLTTVYTGRAAAYGRLGELESKAGRDPTFSYMRALDDYERALETNPNDYLTFNNRAGLLRTMAADEIARGGGGGTYFAEALQDADRGVAVLEAWLASPDLTETQRLDRVRDLGTVLATRGGIHRAMGDASDAPVEHYRRALDDYAASIERHPGFALSRFNRASTRYTLAARPEVTPQELEDLLEGALDDCDRALELDPPFRAPVALRARILRHLARRDGTSLPLMEQSVAGYTKAIGFAPDDLTLREEYVYACADLADARRGSGGDADEDYRRAVEAATELIRRDPKRAGSYDVRAYAAWMRAGGDPTPERLRAVEQDYARYVALEPGQVHGWFNLGKVRHFLADWKGAMEALDRAAALADSPDIQQWRGRVQVELDKTDF